MVRPSLQPPHASRSPRIIKPAMWVVPCLASRSACATSRTWSTPAKIRHTRAERSASKDHRSSLATSRTKRKPMRLSMMDGFGRGMSESSYLMGPSRLLTGRRISSSSLKVSILRPRSWKTCTYRVLLFNRFSCMGTLWKATWWP